ncbi:MAG: NAD-binding protein [Acidimicrobiia bacterium]
MNPSGANDWRRLRVALLVLAGIMIVGTIGYLILGFSLLDAIYQAVTTLTTVGFREVHPLSNAGKVFTIVLILFGVGTALYALGVLIQTLVEGDLRGVFGRKRMDRKIADLHDHVIVCGWGRVGRAIAKELGDDTPIVVLDRDADRLADSPHPWLAGDVTDDAVLQAAGLDRARALVAALDTDAGNLFVTLSARALRPDLFIVSRVRVEESVEKLTRAGADRVVNPQSIGGARMAAFVLQPHVTEFLDVVMHDRDIEFRLEEVTVPSAPQVVGRTLREAQIRDLTGALVPQAAQPGGEFVSNPSPEQVISAADVLIAIGTSTELGAPGRLVAG